MEEEDMGKMEALLGRAFRTIGYEARIRKMPVNGTFELWTRRPKECFVVFAFGMTLEDLWKDITWQFDHSPGTRWSAFSGVSSLEELEMFLEARGVQA